MRIHYSLCYFSNTFKFLTIISMLPVYKREFCILSRIFFYLTDFTLKGNCQTIKMYNIYHLVIEAKLTIFILNVAIVFIQQDFLTKV